ncbi:hypothetical protein P7C70_g4174, partial [Phenoliferia sp. Uapishka_3]
MKARLPRTNKRTALAAKSLSSIIPLYHLSSTFLPLSVPLLTPSITSTFVPAVGSHLSSRPSPSIGRDLSIINTSLLTASLRYSLSPPSLPPPTLRTINLNTSRSDSIREEARDIFANTAGGPTMKESFEMGWRFGDEPPMRKRVREVSERLCGTVAGGRAGLEEVKRMGPEVREFVKEKEADRIRLIEAEEGEGAFGEGFGEEEIKA